jgi:hypothetical protein
MALFLPALASDLKIADLHDVMFGGVMRGSWKASENLSWRVLLGYRDQHYGPQYIILLGMDWKISDKWRIFGDVPSSATVSYAVSPKVNAGLNLYVQTATYRLEGGARYLDYNTTVPGLFAEYYVARNWAVRGNVGYSVPRDLEVFDGNDTLNGIVDFVELGDRVGPVNPEVVGGICFRVGVSYRVAVK